MSFFSMKKKRKKNYRVTQTSVTTVNNFLIFTSDKSISLMHLKVSNWLTNKNAIESYIGDLLYV